MTTSEINPRIPSEKMWSNIRRFCGLNPKTPIHAEKTIQESKNNNDTAKNHKSPLLGRCVDRGKNIRK